MKKLIYFSVIIFVLSIALPQAVFGIGQITKPIIVEDVLRGQEIIEMIRLIGKEGQTENIFLKATGDIKDWVSFYNLEDEDLKEPIKETEVPAGSALTVIVKFNIPGDTPNGQYTGKISVISMPKDKDNEDETTTATVGQKVDRSVSITVIDKEIIKLEAVITPLTYSVEQGQSLKIDIRYHNQGNIKVEPNVQFVVTREGAEIFNVIFPYPESEEAIKPRERKTISNIEWLTAGQPLGQYRVKVDVLLNDQIIKTENFRFNVEEAIVVDMAEKENKFFAAVAFLGGGNAMLGWAIISGILLILVVILIIISRKRFAKY